MDTLSIFIHLLIFMSIMLSYPNHKRDMWVTFLRCFVFYAWCMHAFAIIELNWVYCLTKQNQQKLNTKELSNRPLILSQVAHTAIMNMQWKEWAIQHQGSKRHKPPKEGSQRVRRTKHRQSRGMPLKPPEEGWQRTDKRSTGVTRWPPEEGCQKKQST